MIESTINYLAVIAAAASAMIIGFLWHGPIFGKLYIQLSGLTQKKMKSMPLSATQAMIGGSINALLIAYVLSIFVDAFKAVDATGAATVAFWTWLGFIATTQIAGFLWEGKSIKLFLFNTGYSLVSLTVMSVIVTLWA